MSEINNVVPFPGSEVTEPQRIHLGVPYIPLQAHEERKAQTRAAVEALEADLRAIFPEHGVLSRRVDDQGPTLQQRLQYIYDTL